MKVLPATGGEPVELYKWEEDDVVALHHTWSADGRYIFFIRRFGEKTEESWNWSLWRIPADGGNPQKLDLNMPSFDYNLSAHPNGRHITFTSQGAAKEVSEIWIMENFLPKEETNNK